MVFALKCPKKTATIQYLNARLGCIPGSDGRLNLAIIIAVVAQYFTGIFPQFTSITSLFDG